MPAILDLAEVRDRAMRWSVKDYEHLGEQGILGKGVELIRGIVVKKMSKSPLHFTLVQRLCERLRQAILAGWVLRQEGPLRLADSEPEPDIAIVRGSTDDFLAAHPTTAELVVEVAVSSVALDRENASLYAEAGVTEYWIVLGVERQIEVYRQPENGEYRQKRLYTGGEVLATGGEVLACAAVPGLKMTVEAWLT